MKQSKTREQLIEMYKNSLEEEILPWRKGWITSEAVNGITNIKYRGANQLLLSFVAAKNNYDDSRWFTYLQIKNKGYTLDKKSKGTGVPVEFYSCYNIKLHEKVDFDEYQKIIEKYPEKKKDFRVICNTSYVFNAKYVIGLEKEQNKKLVKINIPTFITNSFKNMNVKYLEQGDSAYYNPLKDEIVLPNKEKFIDEYSYFATQLHELCHATGHEKRLNRILINDNKEDYAREELIAEISSSFLMQKLNIDTKAEHIDNHKTYIQSWIKILNDKPNELFKAIAESNKVCDYVEELSKIKTKERER